jgi:hypothetical protein
MMHASPITRFIIENDLKMNRVFLKLKLSYMNELLFS